MNRQAFPFVLCALLFASCAHQPVVEREQSNEERQLELMRMRAMADVFVLKDYRPGKNSFVENAERHIGAWTGKGYRRTLLEDDGPGSIRHIWTTRREGEAPMVWEFYIDGESEPSIRATDEELRLAMEAYEPAVMPANSVPYANQDFNFFLPIPFEDHIRLDVVQRVDSFWLWFCQIDFRTNDDSLSGVRLIGPHDGSLSYIGKPDQALMQATGSLPLEQIQSGQIALAAGERKELLSLSGPAIVRELRIARSEASSLRLMVRYDGEESFSIDAPVERFFGPFKGASFYQHAPGDSSMYLPMPFRRSCELWIENTGSATAQVECSAQVERTGVFSPAWGYLHANYQITEETDGHHLHQVAYVKGRGQFVGMTMYNTGHDHGGGDFAIIDGEGDDPAFLHGVNGEDYFTFAWFGRGAHHPYAIAHSNEDGRYRHHFENPYPFDESFSMEWGAFPGISPESVCVWYHESPAKSVIPYGAPDDSSEWVCFGPVPVPHDEQGRSVGDPFAVLPPIDRLDAGERFEIRGLDQAAQMSWKTQRSTGPALNLTYLGRPDIAIDPENQLGGMGHAFIARKTISADQAGAQEFILCHDDPLELSVNGEVIYREEEQFNGYQTRRVILPLKQGDNEVVVRLTNYFNRTFNWAGFLLRPTAP